ncbi:acyl-coenzyme A synthetase/AMP-(fatty) acid ligase [Paraburkholderia youngii]
MRACAAWRMGCARSIACGNRVMIYLPMSIEGVVAMQACARIGAPHSVVFGGFSAKSLHERMVEVIAVAVITADEQMRGGCDLRHGFLDVSMEEAHAILDRVFTLNFMSGLYLRLVARRN